MHARTFAMGYEPSSQSAISLSDLTSTSVEPPSPVTFARLGSQRVASAASAKRRPAARLPERLSSVTSPKTHVSGRPRRALESELELELELELG